MSEIDYWKVWVTRNREKPSTLAEVCPDCATKIEREQIKIDPETGEIEYIDSSYAYYGELVEIDPRKPGPKPKRCLICKSEYDRNYQKDHKREIRKRARKKKSRVTPPPRWTACPKYAECIRSGKLDEAAKANNKEFSCQSCETFLAHHPVKKNT